MSRRFNVYIHTTASATIPVTLSDEDLANIAVDYDKEVADLAVDDLTELLETRAYDNVPSLGICCAGWDKNDPSLELGDEWELDEDERNPLAAFDEVTDED